jgi:hypothetical protein
MKYDDNYLFAKDIDWFFRIDHVYIHVASAGGLLPEVINDREKLRLYQRAVFLAPDKFTNEEILINQQFLNERFEENEVFEEDDDARLNYLRSFLAMARKGFVSMDRTNLEDLTDQTYHIVCMPSYLDDVKGLPELPNSVCKDKSIFNGPHNDIKLFDEIVFK